MLTGGALALEEELEVHACYLKPEAARFGGCNLRISHPFGLRGRR